MNEQELRTRALEKYLPLAKEIGEYIKGIPSQPTVGTAKITGV
jgi:hypothetical protein